MIAVVKVEIATDYKTIMIGAMFLLGPMNQNT